MEWRLTFDNERSGLLACYDVEARLPAEAVRLGWNAVLAEHPSTPRGGRLSVFERAERAGGQHSSRWVLYRLANAGRKGTPRVTPVQAA